jgi:chromosome segregation ATPase
MNRNIEAALAILRASIASPEHPAIGGTHQWLRERIKEAVAELEKPVTFVPSDESASNITVAELVERMLTLEARVADLQSDSCHLTNTVSSINATLERISPIGMAEADEERDNLTKQVKDLEMRVSELEDTPESDEVNELGERVETVESDLQELKDDLPVDWEDAVTEKFDELVGDMINGTLKDCLDRVRLRIVSPSEV